MEERREDEKFFLVMLRSSPKDILSLCETDRKMNQLCKKPRIIETLINHFFPYRTIDRENLYREFVRLANTVTIYVTEAGLFRNRHVQTEFGEVVVPEYNDNLAYLTNLNVITWEDGMADIEIMGSPFEREVRLWVMMHDFNDRNRRLSILYYYDNTVITPKTYVFRTYIEAVQETVEIIIGPLFEKLNIEVSDEHFEPIDEAAKHFKLPTPFGIQSLTLALEKYGFVTFQTDDPADNETFTVRELEFTQTLIDDEESE